MTAVRFAVVDVETTGIVPAYDRVIDLAIAVVDETGRVLERLDSVVRPPDPPTDAPHEVCSGAPSFRDLAPNVARLLSGAVPTAHNASFDSRMLLAEFWRAGIRMPRTPWLDTIALARTWAPDAPASLAALHAALGFEAPKGPWHIATVDVDATVQVLGELLRRADLHPSGFETMPLAWDDDLGKVPCPPRPRDSQLWPPRSRPGTKTPAEESAPPASSRSVSHSSSRSINIAIEIPDELLEMLRRIPPDPEVLIRRREQGVRIAAAAGTVDLDTALDWLYGGSFDGPEGWDRLEKVVTTLRVAEEHEDLLEALQRYAAKLAQRQLLTAASAAWYEYATLALDVDDDPEEQAWRLEGAIGRILEWDTPNGIALFQRALEADSPVAAAAMQWVLAHAAKVGGEEGVALAQSVIDHLLATGHEDLVPAARLDRARLLKQAGHLYEARKELLALCAPGVLPEHNELGPGPWVGLAERYDAVSALESLSSQEETVALIQRYIDTCDDPRHLAWERLGLALERIGDYAKALEATEETLGRTDNARVIEILTKRVSRIRRRMDKIDAPVSPPIVGWS